MRWLAILIVAPILGSFSTEPAAMTIGALLLARMFYALKPSPRFAYATLGRLDLKAPLLVGFFLAGLVVHGELQGWWIEPVLKRLDEFSLFLGATVLTALNDNAAITYLATLVPGFTDASKYAVVAGAVTGGGLTVIANAPNPAGQTILQRFLPEGVSPLRLLCGALAPTLILSLCFLLL